MRVIFAQHVADHARALHVRPVPDRVGLVHRKEHAAVHGLQAIADVGKGPAHDHAHGVIEVGMPHFGFEAYRKGFFGELLHRGWRSLSVERFQSRTPVQVCAGTAESRRRGRSRRCANEQTRKRSNFIMTVVLLRQLPTSCCANRNTALQGQNPYAIVGRKSVFSTDHEKTSPTLPRSGK